MEAIEIFVVEMIYPQSIVSQKFYYAKSASALRKAACLRSIHTDRTIRVYTTMLITE